MGSKNERARSWQYESHCMAAGIHGLVTSASPLTVISPPGVTATAGVVSAGVVSAGVVSATGASVPVGAAVAAVVPPVVTSVALPLSFLPQDAAINPRLRTTAVMIRLP